MISASLVKELREKTGAGMLDCKKALEATEGNLEASIDWLREKGISKAAKKADRIANEGLAGIKVEGNKAVIIEVNSETDFVAQNAEFKTLIETLTNAVFASNVTTIEEALALEIDGQTVENLMTEKTAKIGEKLSFRRISIITKKDNEVFGEYLHSNGKIAVITVVEGANEVDAKDVAMHAAAMKPKYVSKDEVDATEIEHEKAVLKEQAINEGKPADIAEKMVEGRIRKYYEEICLEEQAFVKGDGETVAKFLSTKGGKVISMTRIEVGEGIEKATEDFAAEVAKQIKGN